MKARPRFSRMMSEVINQIKERLLTRRPKTQLKPEPKPDSCLSHSCIPV